MLRSILACTVLMILTTILESTWLHVLAIDSVRPDISLILLIYISFKNTKPIGQVSGFLSGLLHDGISSTPLGLTSCIRTLVAWSFNFVSGKFYIDRFFLPFLFGAIATLLKAFYIFIFHLFWGDLINAYSLLGKTLWLEVAYNAMISPILFFIIGFFSKLLVYTEKKI